MQREIVYTLYILHLYICIYISNTYIVLKKLINFKVIINTNIITTCVIVQQIMSQEFKLEIKIFLSMIDL